jgi:hypothetical protein
MRLAIRQAAEEDAIDEAEDGCAGSDAERQREERCNRESPVSQQVSRGKP